MNHQLSIPGLDLAHPNPVVNDQPWRSNRGMSKLNACRALRGVGYEPEARAGVNHEGFTLIELVTILVVLGILAAVAATRLTGTSTISVKGAAEMIQADIRYAQEAAMAENTAKSVIFSPGASSYTVDSENKELPSGVSIGNNFTATFNSLGEPTAGGGGSVSISADGQSKTISVSNYTGKVSID
jgi:prepilin-type N-terminal cleavage/methylation domain-containing protein